MKTLDYSRCLVPDPLRPGQLRFSTANIHQDAEASSREPAGKVARGASPLGQETAGRSERRSSIGDVDDAGPKARGADA
jgi:hypothetical protein